MIRNILLLIIIILFLGVPLFGEKGEGNYYPEGVDASEKTKTNGIIISDLLAFFDAAALEIMWEHKAYPYYLNLTNYEVVTDIHMYYKFSFEGEWRTNVNGDYTIDEGDHDTGTITLDPENPGSQCRITSDNHFIYTIPESMFPARKNGKLTIYSGTIKIRVYYVFQIHNTQTGDISTLPYSCGKTVEAHVYVFNEEPAKPVNIVYSSINEVYAGATSADRRIWAGPKDWIQLEGQEEEAVKIQWQSDLRVRDQNYSIIKKDGNSREVISKSFFISDTLTLQEKKLLLLGRKDELENLKGDTIFNHSADLTDTAITFMNGLFPNDNFNNNLNKLIIGADDKGTDKQQKINKMTLSETFDFYYDKKDPELPAESEVYKAGLYSDFTYTFSWPPATDLFNGIELSGINSYKWVVKPVGSGPGETEWTGPVVHDDGEPFFSVTRPLVYPEDCEDCPVKIERNTEHYLFIRVRDNVWNEEDFTPVMFKAPPNMVNVEEITPTGVLKDGITDEPVYTVNIVVDIESYFVNESGNTLYEQYFSEDIINITFSRTVDTGELETMEQDFNYASIFEDPDTMWAFNDEGKLIYTDVIRGPEFAHSRPEYRITTLFGIDPDDNDITETSSSDSVEPLANYFPEAEVVMNRGGDDICKYFSKDSPGIIPGDSMMIGRNTTFLFTSEEMVEGRDIEGDTISASVYRTNEEDIVIDGPLSIPFHIPMKASDLLADVSGEARIYIQFDDDQGDESAKTETVIFTYDAENPRDPEFIVHAIDRPDVILGTDYGTRINVVTIDGITALDAFDPQTPDTASGVEKLLFWNRRENQNLDQDLSNYVEINPGHIGSENGYRVLDITGHSFPDGEADLIASGTKGILIDIVKLNQTEPGILPVTDGLVPLRITWPFAQVPAGPVDDPYSICLKSVDGVENTSETAVKTFNLDTIPPGPPSGYPVFTAFQENETDKFGNMHIEFTGPLGEGSEPIPLSDVNGDTIKYYYNYQFVETPAVPPEPGLTLWAEGLPFQEVKTENLHITIEVTEQSQWDNCIKMSLWAEDEAGNKSEYALYDNHIFSAAFPSSDLVQTNRDNDVDDDNHIYFRLLPSSDDISHGQKLVLMESIEPPVPADIEIQPDMEGCFSFDNSGQGCTGHKEYGFRIIARNQHNDERPGEIFTFIPPNHDVSVSGTEDMSPSRNSYLNTINNFSFAWAPFIDVDGNDSIYYRVYCRKAGDTGEFTLLSIPEGILETELYRDEFVTTALLNGTEADEDEYEWYIEGYDTYIENDVLYMGNSVRLPATGSPEETTVFTIDNTKPEVSIIYSPGTYISNHTLEVTIEEQTSSPILYYTDNSDTFGPVHKENLTIIQEGVYSYTLTLYNDGVRTISVTVTDSASNPGTDTVTVSVDTTPPETGTMYFDLPVIDNAYVSATGIVRIGGLTDTFSGVKDITLQFKDTNGETIYNEENILVSDNPGDTGEHYIEVPLKGDIENVHHVSGTVIVNDWAGNSIEWTAPHPVVVDVTNPRITAFTIVGLEKYMSSLLPINLEVTAEDPQAAIKSIHYAIGDTGGNPVSEWEDTWGILQGNYTNKLSGYTTLAQGTYTVLARAETVYGLSTQARSDPFIVDTTPPEFSVTVLPAGDVMPGQTLRISIDASDPESFVAGYECGLGSSPGSVDISEQIMGNVDGWFFTTGETGEFTLTLPGSLVNGACYVSVKVTNGAGVSATNKGAEYQAGISEQEVILVKDHDTYTSDTTSLQSRWEYKGSREVSCYLYDVLDENDTVITAGNNGLLTDVFIGNLNLLHGSTYRFRITAYFTDGTDLSGESLGITVDTTPPEFFSTETEQALTFPYAAKSDRIPIGWNGKDNESGIKNQEVLVERYDENGERIVVTGGWLKVSGDSTYISTDINGESLDLVTGDRVYVTVRLTNGAYLMQEKMSSFIIIDNSPPPVPFVMDNGVIVNVQSAPDVWVNWKWSNVDPESGTTQYLWTVSPVKSETGLDGWLSDIDEDKTVLLIDHPDFAGIPPEMLHGQSWYVAVKAVNGAGIESGIGWSDGITFDMTAPFITEVKLLASGMLAGEDDLEYISRENVTDGLVLYIHALEDIAGTIASYTGGFEKRNIEEGSWIVDPYTVSKVVTPEDPDGMLSLAGIIIEPGVLCRFRGSAKNAADMESARGYTGGAIYDNTIPEITDIHVFALGDSFHFDWRVRETATITPINSCKVAFVKAGDTASRDDFIDNPYGFESYIQDTGGLPHGEYRLCIMVSDAAGNSALEYTDSIAYDQTPPLVSFALPKGYDSFVSKTMDFNVNIEEDLSSVREYQYRLGSFENPGILTGGWMNELLGLGTGMNRLERTFCFPGFEGTTGSGKIQVTGTLIDQQNLFLTVRAKNSQGKWSEPLTSQEIITDLTPPTTPVAAVPEYTGYANRVLFDKDAFYSEDAQSGVTHFRLAVVEDKTDAQAVDMALENAASTVITQLPEYVQFPGLDHEEQRYVAVQTLNGAKDWSLAGFSNLFTVDLMPPVIELETPVQEIIVNDIPYEVAFTVDEYAELQLTLFDGSNEQISTSIMTCGHGGTYSYTFNVPPDAYDTYTLKVTEIKDIVGNLSNNLTLASIRLNAPPNIAFGDMATFPGKKFILNATVFDPDNDGIAGFQWFVKEDTDFIPLSSFLPYGESGVAFESVFTHHVITDQRTEYEVRLDVTDLKNKQAVSGTIVVVVNTQYGELCMDEYWTGEHILKGNVTVPEGITLTVDSARVKARNVFGYEEIYIDVKGTITVLNYTEFMLDPEAAYDYWTGIYISGTGTVSESRIEKARFGITSQPGSVVEIRSTIFRENEIGVRAHGSVPLIIQNSFINNSIYGIKEDAGALPVVNGCSFSGNLYDYYDDQGVILDPEDINTIQEENYDNTSM